MSSTEELDEFPVKVDDDVYGPIKIDRIISDVREGKLTDKAKFWAGIIGLVSLVIIATSWDKYETVMTVSALLTSISTWAYLRSSQMKS